jgi:hypothetical protein
MFDPKPPLHVAVQPSLGPTLIGVTYRPGRPGPSPVEERATFPRQEPPVLPPLVPPTAPPPPAVDLPPPRIGLSVPGTELAALHAILLAEHAVHQQLVGLRVDLEQRSAVGRWRRLCVWLRSCWRWS